MKKINLTSVVKGITLSPVYITGFVYEIGRHVVNKFRQQEETSADNPAIAVVKEVIADVARHYNDENTDELLNNGRGRTIYDNPENVNILSGKEDTL